MDVTRETDVEQLRLIAQTALKENERLLKLLAAQSEKIDRLTGKPGELQRALELAAQLQRHEAAETGTRKRTKKRKRKKRTTFGPTPQPDLPVVTETFELDAPDMMCPACGGDLRELEGQFETTELVDVIEVSYRLVQARQKKYVCACGGCVETAPGPERAVRGGRYSLAFAAKVACDKYLDHLPLERQVRIMKRHGLDVSSQTLWKQTDSLARELEPIYEALREKALAQPVIGVDQTGWKRLSNKNATPYQMWCVTAPKIVLHAIRDDKSAATMKELLGDYEGVVVCDAMKSHEAVARGSPGIELAGCWGHVFRKYQEAAPDHPEAQRVLAWIGELYDIDASASDDTELATLRDQRSRRVLTELKAWLMDLEILTSTSIGNAARYTHANWARLTLFVDDVRIPLDNNATERGIRGPVVGRKNHYGSRSRRGTEVASIFYTLMETAKLNGLDPAQYIADAIRAARLGEILLPLT